jgi:hypothetical protein
MAVAQGQLMLASDILSLSFFPIGSVVAINGTVTNTASGCQVNGQQLPGWYICNGENHTPNLVGRFIAGTDSARGNDGAEAVELTAAHLPAHTHTVTVSSIGNGGSHSHGIPVDRFDDYNFSGARSNGNENGDHASGRPSSAWCYGVGNGWYYDSRNVNTSSASIPSHLHNISGSIGNNEENTKLTLLPAYYALVFIRKCA